MNIYDVAAKAGVSTATVSRVLNHSPHVSRLTADRVIKVMHAMGYAPNVFARGLAGSSTKVLGVLCVGISDVYFASALRAIEKNARAIGYDVTLLCDGADSTHLREHITQMSERRVDGLILVGSIWTQEAGEEFLTVIGKRVPVMVLGGRISAKKVYCVSCDDREGVSSAVSYLSRAGRGRLVYVYDTDTPSGRDKLAGFRTACQSAGLTPHTLKSDRGVRGGVRIAGSILKSGENFDAVVCSDDLIAAGILQNFARRKIDVPGTIAVIGYNNLLIPECTFPGLCSVNSHVDELSALAVSNLVGAIEGKSVSHTALLIPELVIRESVPGGN